MANAEHLKILQQGVEMWNAWRFDNPDITPDLSHGRLSGLSLSGAILSGAELQGAVFSGTTLPAVSFYRAAVKGTNFSNAILTGADFREAILEDTIFYEATLKDVNFMDATLKDVNFMDATLKDVEFSMVPLEDADFRRASLESTDFLAANLKGAEFFEATLKSVSFEGATLLDSDMTAVTFEGAVFFRASMRDVRFLDAVLDDADFRFVTAEEAVFFGASLRGANFKGAVLKGADLRAKTFQGASLQGTDLTEADLRTQGLHFDDSKLLHARLTARPASAARRWLDPFFIRSPKTDRWSELRRAYTGPNFIITLLFLMAFFLPLVLGAATWRGIASVEDAIVGLEMVCGTAPCPSYRVWQLLLGVHEGWAAVALTAVLTVYNGIRFYVTGAVSAYREEEERSGFTPAWQGTEEDVTRHDNEYIGMRLLAAVHGEREAPWIARRLQAALQGYEHLVWLHITLRFLAFIAVVAFLWRAWEVLSPVVHVVPA